MMLGKTTLGALAWGDVWFGGETRNPWNPKEGASGSSAGSGSATAAGLCAFGIGTETLGSIVSPADRNGLTGLRPTFGRVSRAGAMALCWSLDKIGPMCRYTEDNALVLAALNGFDVADASSIDMGFTYDGREDITGLTVGYDPAWFEGEDVRSTDRSTLEALANLDVARLDAAGLDAAGSGAPALSELSPLTLVLGRVGIAAIALNLLVIATGQRTGDSATMEEIDEIRAATELPLLVGSGVTPGNVRQILGRTQGVIVASTMKVDGVWWNDVELARVKHFMSVAQAALEEE